MDKSEVAESPSEPHASDRLRILLVVNLPWDPRLGAVRVFMELADQWRAAGHTVESYSASDAFTTQQLSPSLSAIRQIIFSYKSASFVRKNSERFDVVDALIGSLHGSKKRLRLSGLLVARSVGLYLLYEQFEREAQRRWPVLRGKLSTKIFYDFVARWFRRLFEGSVRQADLVNVPNEEEKEALRGEDIPAHSITVQPYGLTRERSEALARAAAPAESRLRLCRVSFVGMWAPRKGSRDWPDILRLVWQQVPDARFCFLGTMVEPDKVLRDLGLKFSERVETIPEYSQEQLPGLLSECAVGAFPSYVEGFGLAVLEQLAAGLPTVAFNVAGPRDILGALPAGLLAPVGDVPAFADLLIRILKSEPAVYQELSRQCSESAARFNWAEIANETARIYRTHLAALPHTQGFHHVA